MTADCVRIGDRILGGVVVSATGKAFNKVEIGIKTDVISYYVFDSGDEIKRG